MILTKMLSGVSLGTTLREPLGKSAETILRRRLEEKDRRACVISLHRSLNKEHARVYFQMHEIHEGHFIVLSYLCVVVLLSHLILMM